jgi:hypothetical protein
MRSTPHSPRCCAGVGSDHRFTRNSGSAGAAGSNPHNRRPGSRAGKRYGHDHGLRAIGGAHGQPIAAFGNSDGDLEMLQR